MTMVVVVEPNGLLRLGALQLLQQLKCNLTIEGIDYARLFNAVPRDQVTDLMLLSVPDVYDRMVELVRAAQFGYAPKRILLVSDAPTLNYSLLKLPPTLAGYISKHASLDILSNSIRLVLAGGKCFPLPEDPGERLSLGAGDGAPSGDAAPRRRWYDREQGPPKPCPDLVQPDNLLTPESAHLAVQEGSPPPPWRREHPPNPTLISHAPQSLSPELANQESAGLNLTPRQYEVLSLLARGYSLKKVSTELGISVATTKAHTEALYQRLAVHNRNTAVYAAVARGATLGCFEARSSGRRTAEVMLSVVPGPHRQDA